MWIILVFVCVSVILQNNAQELPSYRMQTNTESSYSSNRPNWDSTRIPTTLTIRNGRTENVDRSITKDHELPLFYSNQRQQILMPIGYNSNRDSDTYENETDHSVNRQSVTTFLRRPDSESNSTVLYRYPQLVGRNEFAGVPAPYAPITYLERQPNINPDSLISNTVPNFSEALPNENLPTTSGNFQNLIFHGNTQSFIPQMDSFRTASLPKLNSNGENLEINDFETISSSSVTKSSDSDAISTRSNDEITKALPTESDQTNQEINKPMFLYRNNERFLSPFVHRYYPSYRLFPFQGGDMFHPVVPYPSNNPNFERESVLEAGRDLRIPQKQVLYEDISDKNIPSETSTDINRPNLLPLPAGGYPFRVYQPSFIPALIPNFPTSDIPLNLSPFSQPTHFSRERPADASVSSPIAPVRFLPGVHPEVLSPTDNIATEEQISVRTELREVPEIDIILENPNITKIPYEFGYDMNDGKGNDQHRKEISDISGVVTGSYGYKDAYGVYRLVNYIANKDGFQAVIKSNEPGVASSGSANVVLIAERPPPRLIAEGKIENDTKELDAPDTKVDLNATGSIPETK